MEKEKRLELSLQYQILKKLSDDKKTIEEYEAAIKVLNEGFSGEYSNVLYGFQISEDELSEEDCQLARQILDMFMRIKLMSEHEEALSDSERTRLRFNGFDGNDSREAAFAAYSKFLISPIRFAPLMEDIENEKRLNSHHPILEQYKKMLISYEKTINDGELTNLQKLQKIASNGTLRIDGK